MGVPVHQVVRRVAVGDEAVWAAREIVARLNDADTGRGYERWVERARGCQQPVRLVGGSRDADGLAARWSGSSARRVSRTVCC
jgi:hypothetical protein